MAKPNREIALDAIKRTGGFSEAEKDALINAFRKSMFPGNWSTDTPDDDDIIQYDAASETWEYGPPPGGTFLSLSDTPATFSGASNYVIKVNTISGALEFVNLFDLLETAYGFPIQFPLVPNTGDVLTFDASGEWQPQALGVSSVNGSTGAVVLDIDDVTPTTTKGDIIVDDGTNATRLGVGTDGHVLTLDSGEALGVKWAASPSGFADPMTTRGDLIYKNAAGTTTRLPAGTANQVLTSDGTDIAWAASVAGTNVFTGLNDTPASYSGQANKWLKVTSAADAIEFTSASPVTQVTGTSPVVSSGGTTPAISMAAATSGNHGYMTSTYAAKLDGIEAGADVTDAINVAAAGAYMKTVTVSTSAPSGGSDGDVWYQVV